MLTFVAAPVPRMMTPINQHTMSLATTKLRDPQQAAYSAEVCSGRETRVMGSPNSRRSNMQPDSSICCNTQPRKGLHSSLVLPARKIKSDTLSHGRARMTTRHTDEDNLLAGRPVAGLVANVPPALLRGGMATANPDCCFHPPPANAAHDGFRSTTPPKLPPVSARRSKIPHRAVAPGTQKPVDAALFKSYAHKR